MKVAWFDNPETMQREMWVDGVIGKQWSALWCIHQCEEHGESISPRWKDGHIDGNQLAIPDEVMNQCTNQS